MMGNFERLNADERDLQAQLAAAQERIEQLERDLAAAIVDSVEAKAEARQERRRIVGAGNRLADAVDENRPEFEPLGKTLQALAAYREAVRGEARDPGPRYPEGDISNKAFGI